jgi:3-phenylpropionate/cinnamic acid dioxygenase small subunit
VSELIAASSFAGLPSEPPPSPTDGGVGLDDRTAITDLLLFYNYAFDSGDADAWACCFTRDGRFEGRAGVFEGRDALREYANAARSRGTIRHFTGNVLIYPGARSDTAVAYSYMLYYTVGPTATVFETTATQVDQLVKQSDGWKIGHRKLTVDVSAPAA